MMNLKCEESGRILTTIEPPIGAGGEGTIWGVESDPEIAVKLYSADPVPGSLVKKLRAMLAKPPEDRARQGKHASIAWPTELVTDVDNPKRILGFTMPRLHNLLPLSDLSDVKERQQILPGLSYKHLCRIATNLASAVTAIHQTGCVIGDVNESNIMATEEALVSLVDTDSFQIVDSITEELFPCLVYQELYCPPEFNPNEVGKRVAPSHDLYGIGTLFFQLLMQGTRPFTGIYCGPGEPPDITEWISRGYFPYGGHPDVKPKPLAPAFSMLHPEIQTLFLRCFVDGHTNPKARPTAEVWYQTLAKAEKSLIKCEQQPHHRYFSHYGKCPWCQQDAAFKAAGLVFESFPAPVRPNNSAGTSAEPATGTNGRTSGTCSHVSSPRTPPVNPAPPPSATGTSNQHSGSWTNVPPSGQTRSANTTVLPSSQTRSTRTTPPPPPPPPSAFFKASNTVVSIGEPVTLHWSIPSASSVRISKSLLRTVFAGQTPQGSVEVYPVKNQTYRITSKGAGRLQLAPLQISVRQVPIPVALSEVQVPLKEPIALQQPNIRLQEIQALIEVRSRLAEPMPLGNYLALRDWEPLDEITIALIGNPD